MENLNNDLKINSDTENIKEVESEKEIDKNDMPISEEENSNTLKDYFYKETGLTIKDLALLFGQTEEEISKEFSTYKAKKLYSKMDYIIDKPYILQEEFKNECLLAVKYGFKSVTVLPTYVSLAKSFLIDNGVQVRALIAYPFGEEISKVKILSVKKAVQMGASGILVSPSIKDIKNKNFKLVGKEIKKIVRSAGRKQVTVMLDENLLSIVEMEEVVKAILKETKVYSIMSSSVFSDKISDMQAVKNVSVAIDGRCYVEGGGKIETASQTVQLLASGANSITSKYCPMIAKELNMKIISSV